jgi:hypothetical protein
VASNKAPKRRYIGIKEWVIMNIFVAGPRRGNGLKD